MRGFALKVTWPVLGVAIAALLFALPGRSAIAPRIQADNNYIYLAADRLLAGQGLTSLLPLAPVQPWEWQADWAFLTQWPMGYPVLLCAVRLLVGCTTVQAGQIVAVLSCAAAVVAWFAWARRVLPRGTAATMLGAVAAGSAVSTEALINPQTDTIVVALLPLVLLAVHGASTQRRAQGFWLIAAGLFAGLLCWIRYAAIYIPLAGGLFLIAEWIVRRRVRFRSVAAFAAGAALPVLALVVVNRVYGSAVPVQMQYNLGSRIGFAMDPTVPVTVWWRFTDLPFYNHVRYSHWMFAAVVPLGAVGVVCIRSSWRKAARSLVTSPGFILSACVVGSLFLLLIGVSEFCRAKHSYVTIDRYYLAVRPLYFLLFLGPLLAIPTRSVRAMACLPLLLCLSWYVQVEWPRPYKRWLAAQRPFTEYGRWAVCFEPGGNGLYRWLRERNVPDLIVCSNFHDEIAVETWLPACPLPVDEQQLARWVERIRDARDIDEPKVLFVLDPSNHTRDYYLPPPRDVIARFALTPCRTAPETIRPYVFEYAPRAARLAAVR